MLAIEFAPVVFEGLKWQKFAHFIHRFIMPFVILGVVLSTLHQSSLGSLAADPTYQALSALVDTHPAGVVLHFGSFHWLVHDHF